jgi:hypothetical protein
MFLLSALFLSQGRGLFYFRRRIFKTDIGKIFSPQHRETANQN